MRKIVLAFLGGVWGMLPQKILKIKYLRLAKNALPKIFQLTFLYLKHEITSLNHYLEKSERFRSKITLKQFILYRSSSRRSKKYS